MVRPCFANIGNAILAAYFVSGTPPKSLPHRAFRCGLRPVLSHPQRDITVDVLRFVRLRHGVFRSTCKSRVAETGTKHQLGRRVPPNAAAKAASTERLCTLHPEPDERLPFFAGCLEAE